MSIGDALLWTTCVGQDPMTMKQLVTRYRHKLPIIVSVVDGYFGCYGQDIGSNEMFWVYDIARQERILVRDRTNRLFSIPTDYKTMFHVVTDVNKMSRDVMPLKDAIETINSASSLASHEIVLQNDQPVTVGIGAKRTKFGRLGVLEVIDTYELKYLQAHSIYEDKLDSATTPIPVFMDLTFSVAIGSRHGTEQEFRDWETQIKAIGNSFQHLTAAIECGEIIFFDQRPDDELEEGHYEYMRPMNVVFTQDEHDYEHIVDKIIPVHLTSDTTTIMPLEVTDTPLPAPSPPPPPVYRKEPAVLPPLSLGPGPDDSSSRIRAFMRSQSVKSASQSPPPIPVRLPRKSSSSTATSSPITPRSTPPLPPSSSPSPRRPMSRSYDDLRGSAGVGRRKGSNHTVSESGSPTCSRAADAGAGVEDPSTPATTAHSLRQFLFADEVPRDIDFASLSKTEVAHCLCLLNMWPLAGRFEELDIDGALLLNLSEDILRTDLGMKTSEARKLMKFARDKWRPSRKRHSRLTE